MQINYSDLSQNLSAHERKMMPMIRPWFLLVMMRRKKEPLLNQNKYTGSFQYKAVFKESWKADYLIKAVLNDRYKFHCLPRKNMGASAFCKTKSRRAKGT